jgi:dTDP-4-amino-4,6-dideoxygalactose transaminase
MAERIPFNKPFVVGKELYNIAEAVLDGWIAGDGRFTERCHHLLEQRYGIAKALLTHSCTAALEMAAVLCEVGPEDEVILPSYTFVSTVNAFVLRGTRPRFVDIRPDTLNLDENLIEEAITERTKVIAPVHYAGVGCEMDRIVEVAKKHGLFVVEDAAQALGAKYRGQYLGTFGELGCYSFHETKNLISGEGGALAVNSAEFADRAEIVRQKGTNRAQFLRGEVDKYSWVDIGSSYLPSEIVAAFLLAQLENEGVINSKRMALWRQYHEALADLEEQGCLRRPRCPEHCSPNAHMYYILAADSDERQELIEHLAEHNIKAVFHYVPLHTAPMGREFGYRGGELPVTEELSERILRLPLYYELSEDGVLRVAEAIRQFYLA